MEDDEYVLRHRPTGLVITAYSGQSGPSYGGGPRYPGELPKPETLNPFASTFERQKEAQARIAADPELEEGEARSTGRRSDFQSTPQDVMQELRTREARWNKRHADARAPAGFPAVASALDAKLAKTKPADWAKIEYYGDAPSVSRFGVKDGRSFADVLDTEASLAFLVSRADGAAARGSAGRQNPFILSGEEGDLLSFYVDQSSDEPLHPRARGSRCAGEGKTTGRHGPSASPRRRGQYPEGGPPGPPSRSRGSRRSPFDALNRAKELGRS